MERSFSFPNHTTHNGTDFSLLFQGMKILCAPLAERGDGVIFAASLFLFALSWHEALAPPEIKLTKFLPFCAEIPRASSTRDNYLNLF
jgi:hypothetical protein